MLSQLARYKTPPTYEFSFEPIRDEVGKIRKSTFRKHFQTADAQQRSQPPARRFVFDCRPR
jgi:hypothetical protein